MAINFLSNVNLNDNELLGAAIQNLGTDPASGVLGQIYFNTSEDALKVCTVASTTNATWAAVGGGVETISKATGTNPITLTGTTDVLIGITQATANVDGFLTSTDWNTFNNKTSNLGTVTSVGLSIDETEALDIAGTNPVTSSGTIDLEWQGDSSQVVLGSGELDDYTDGTVTSVGLSIDNSAALGVAAASTPITGSGTLDLEWQGASTEYVTADGGKVSIPTTDNYNFWTLSDANGSATDIVSEDTVTFDGTANEIEVAEGGGTITISQPDDVTIGRDLAVTRDLDVTGDLDVNGVSDLDSLAVKNKATSAATAGSDAATTLTTKGYVDSLTSGQLIYAGGYDASTDPPTGASILQGYTYVVTTAGSGAGGTYWSTPLAIGDLIIATVDNPSAESDWTEVNKNVAEATLTTIGEGNVNPGEGIDVSYSNGTATVSGEDSSATNKGIVIVEGGTNITATYDNSGTVTLDADLAGTVTSVGLSIDNTDALDIAGTNPVTSSGTIDLEWQGDSSEYVDGSGALQNFPTIPQGDITKVDVTSPINGGGTSGDVTIGIDNATLTAVGAASIAAGTGISVSVSNGKFTVTNSDPGSTASNGERYSLGATSGAVTANGTVGGATSWTINTVTDLGKSDAKDVTCEVIESTGGGTVFTDVKRSSGTLTITFNGTVANDVFEAILIAI
jgi:hypothetical protein